MTHLNPKYRIKNNKINFTTPTNFYSCITQKENIKNPVLDLQFFPDFFHL